MKKVYERSGTPARPPVNRTPAEEEAFQLSKTLAQEILSASHSRFWRTQEPARAYASEDDFDLSAIVSEMKKKYPLLPESEIAQEVKRRIYLHHLR
jgi:hypothetical protein